VPFQDLTPYPLKKVIQVLNQAGTQYMITAGKTPGGSEKQFTDALRVYEVQCGKLDIDYLEQWAKKLNVGSLWKRLVDEAETV